MDADMPGELMELLEKIVLHNSDFSSNQDLQNLLLFTAIKTDRTKVMEYINRLDNFDGDHLAEIALNSKYQLYDEALAIYKKKNQPEKVIDVYIDYMHNLSAASEYAEKINKPQVWSKLGRAYIDAGRVEDAIESYCRAKDHSDASRVIDQAEASNNFEALVKFLLMARAANSKNPQIDSELIYAYAQTNMLSELQDFIHETNQGDILKVGDRCYEERLFEAAKILYMS